MWANVILACYVFLFYKCVFDLILSFFCCLFSTEGSAFLYFLCFAWECPSCWRSPSARLLRPPPATLPDCHEFMYGYWDFPTDYQFSKSSRWPFDISSSTQLNSKVSLGPKTVPLDIAGIFTRRLIKLFILLLPFCPFFTFLLKL